MPAEIIEKKLDACSTTTISDRRQLTMHGWYTGALFPPHVDITDLPAPPKIDFIPLRPFGIGILSVDLEFHPIVPSPHEAFQRRAPVAKYSL
jgi:hypothetical protein